MRGPHDDPSLTDEELTAQRTRWFETYTAQKNVFADQMVVKSTGEIAGVEKRLDRTSARAEQRRPTTRLLASKKNLRSWQDYIDQNSPREPRAVVTSAA